MNGSGAAAKQQYERELQVNNQKIRELEEELAVSKRLTSDLRRKRDLSNLVKGKLLVGGLTDYIFPMIGSEYITGRLSLRLSHGKV
jgi:hypothetical protein